MDDLRGPLIESLRSNASQWKAEGSPFYGVLIERVADDVEAGGPTWTVLSSHAGHPRTELPAIRMLDAVHRRVLSGHAPALVTHYPSTGGDGDAGAAWAPFLDVVVRNSDELRKALDHPPQTNAVGRCPAIVGGLLTVAAETALPVRLLELGASAGLLLLCDHYRYESGSQAWGDPLSPVRFVDSWVDGLPPSALRWRSSNVAAVTNTLSIPGARTTDWISSPSSGPTRRLASTSWDLPSTWLPGSPQPSNRRRSPTGWPPI